MKYNLIKTINRDNVLKKKGTAGNKKYSAFGR